MEFLNDPIHDVADLLCDAQQRGKKAFLKFRQNYNGDGTVEYKFTDKEVVTISPLVLSSLNGMMNDSAEDNLERPFFVVFDEESLSCIDAIIGRPGDEGYCPHDKDLVDESYARCTQLQATYSKPLLLSRGHTHPVFPEQNYSGGYYASGGLYSSRGQKSRFYGALPSNIKGNLDEWKERMSAAENEPGSQNRSAIINQSVIRTRAYKKHCEDYIESYLASHTVGFNGTNAGEALGSRFHWIITPRLRQIGVFETPKDQYGVVIYHRWKVAGSEVPAVEEGKPTGTNDTTQGILI